MVAKWEKVGRTRRTGAGVTLLLTAVPFIWLAALQVVSIGGVGICVHHPPDFPWLISVRSAFLTGDRIDTDTQPFGNQYTLLTLPLIIKTENSENRYKIPPCTVGDVNDALMYRGSQCSVLTSTCLISPHLGRQLTLIGAKPSGTG